MHHWSRRNFLATLSGTTAAVLLNPFSSFAATGIDPRVAAIVAATIGIDTHNHVDVPLAKELVPGPQLDISGEMKRSGLSAICATFAVDYQQLVNPGDAYNRFINGLDSMDQQLKLNGMQRALNLADLKAAHQQKQPVVIQSVEGCHFLEGKLERVEESYRRGLRHLGLLHDHDASVPLGDVYTNPPAFGGLTPFGAAVIRECNRLGILVDLAHASNDTVVAALKVAKHPVLVSHTGLDTQLGNNERMANMMKPRLISKDTAKIIAGEGGVVGVWTHLADNPLEYAQNVRALVDVIGVEHVCIGTDTKLAGVGPSRRPGERTNEAWQNQEAGFYYVVVDALLKTGFSEADIAKIGGGNFCRLFDDATAGHH